MFSCIHICYQIKYFKNKIEMGHGTCIVPLFPIGCCICSLKFYSVSNSAFECIDHFQLKNMIIVVILLDRLFVRLLSIR